MKPYAWYSTHVESLHELHQVHLWIVCVEASMPSLFRVILKHSVSLDPDEWGEWMSSCRTAPPRNL